MENEKTMLVAPGMHIQRTLATWHDNPDGFINSIKDALFEIAVVNERCVEVRCIASKNNVPSVGSEMSIPRKYLAEGFFIHVPRRQDEQHG